MNKSSLAFTGKLNREQFSANLTLNWSLAVCLKLTMGKGSTWYAWGLLRLYLLCDNSDVQYFCCMREDTPWPYLNFTNIKMYLFSKGNIPYHK